MKTTRPIIHIDEELCNGCGQCILDCAEGAIRIEDGKARVIAEMYCDGLGACLSGCPTGALSIVERESAPYDEDAVRKHLASQGRTLPGHSGGHARCPGSAVSSPASSAAEHCPGMSASAPASPFASGATPKGFAAPGALPGVQWPLKLRLMPSDAAMLCGADVLLAADCAAFARPEFHQLRKPGSILLIACPKFEGAQAVDAKLREIMEAARPASVTVVRMEVPCCKGLAKACMDAAASVSPPVPVHEVVVTRSGDLA